MYHVPACRPPSYWRRQERRKAAKAAAGQGPIQAEQACVDIDRFDLEITVPAAEEATETENIASDEAEKVQELFECEICDFNSNWENGLKVHMTRIHSKI